MRVLMLNYAYPPIGGGAARVTRALSEQLALNGHTVDVVTMGYGHLPFEESTCSLWAVRCVCPAS